jgi:hypothetical protein
MKNPLRLFSAFAVLLFATVSSPAQSMKIDSLDGPVTANEIGSFRDYMLTRAPATWATTGGMENEYAQGHSGENIKALGLMYELSRDTGILDRMIFFCDTLLSQRNDLLAAPQGQLVYNTGTIAPAWPSALTTTPIYSTSASGDCAGHLAYCARLILQTPALANVTVPIGDSFGYGATYRQRALRYIAEADFCFDHYFFPYMLNLSDGNRLKYSASSPYQPGNQLPWNQALMMIYPLQNLAADHELVGDDPTRVTNYDAIVQVNVGRFFTDPAVKIVYTDADGQTAYNWAYSPTANSGEDSNHGALDVAGFYRAYQSGRYGVSTAQMIPFANMFCDVMTRTVGSDYAGRVDGTDGTGHGAPTNYVRSAYLFTGEFRPDQYYNLIAGAKLAAGSTTTSPDGFSRAMWEKNARYLASQAFTLSVAPTAPSAVAGNAVDLTVTVSNTLAAPVALTVTGLPPGASATVAPGSLMSGTATVTVSTAAATTPGIYTLLVRGIAGTTTQVASVDLQVSSLTQVTAPKFSPDMGTYSSVQSVTISTPTSGASIRYTLDGTTPSATVGTLYTGPVAINATATLKAIAYASGLTNSLVTTAKYTLVLPPAAPPNFSVAEGTYATAQSVTIASTTSGASVRYTLDGSIPSATNGILYTGPVLVTYTTTLKAIAFATGLSTSAETDADYVIGGVVPGSLTIPLSGILDSNHSTGFVPANTVDDDFSTRWAASGDGAWIQYDLGYVATLNSANIAWYLGTARTYTFDLLVSSDGLNWTTVINHRVSSGTTNDFESFNFSPVVGQFIRIVGHKSSIDLFINIVELEIWGVPTLAAPSVAAPAFSSAAGSYSGPQSVALSTFTSGASIRYTLDGSSPSPSTGTLYTAPIAISANTTIKAIAYKTGLLNSPVVSSAYTITNTITKLATPTLTDSNHSSSFVPANTIDGNLGTRWAASGDGAWITYDLGALKTVNFVKLAWYEPSGTPRIYPFDVLVSSDAVTWTTLISRATNTGTTTAFEQFNLPTTNARYVRVVGHKSNVDNFINLTETEIWGLNVPTVAAPVLGLASGTYAGRRSVTLSTPTAGASIRYTLDGTTPTASTGTLYAGPILLDFGGTTLKAIAFAAGMADSPVSSAAYTILDNTPPTLILPPNLTLEATSAAGAVATLNASATDDRDGSVTVTFSPASGSTFPLGVTTVTASATDAASNQATGTFTVTVVDTTMPALTPPANLVVEATGPNGAMATFAASATDAVSTPVVEYSIAPGSVFPLGTTTVTVTATDAAGNAASGTFTVTVSDTTAPALTLPVNFTVEATGPNGAPATFAASATDAVSTPTLAYSATPGSVFALGTTTVTATATDAAGNKSTGTFTVTVVDTTAPTLALPHDLLVEATGPSGAAVSFVATATDAVSTPTIVYSVAPGSIFPLGPTAVNVTATDAAGNVSNGAFTVTVRDTTAPALTLPENMTLEATGPNGATVTFAASATDAVSTPTLTYSVASGSIFPLGTTTVTATATDAAGNKSNGTFTVTVIDTTAPALAVPHDLVVEATGANGAVVFFAATATDAVSTPTIGYDVAPGSTFPLGTTTVNVTATDAAGNTAHGAFMVTVRDTTAPVIAALTASPNTIWPPNNKMVAVTLTAQASDAVGVLALHIVSVSANESVSPSAMRVTGPLALELLADRDGNGSGRLYTIIVEARDSAGNASTRAVTVSVPHDSGK